MKKLIILCIFLVGCDEQPVVDQCERERQFFGCLQEVKDLNPNQTVYNDADEIIAECASQAYYNSLRLRGQVSKECRM